MTRSQMDAAYARIDEAKREIEALREACPHPSYRVGWFSRRLGAMNLARLCNECDKHLGEPSTAEAAAFKAAERDERRAFLVKEYGEAAADEMMKGLP